MYIASELPEFDILFLEVPLVNLKKIAFIIAGNIKKVDKDVKLGVVCMELPPKKNECPVDYFFHREKIQNIDDFLLTTKVKEIVFTHSTIPDLEYILHAKKLGIKTIMIQEGVMFDGMNINDVSLFNFLAIFGYMGKTLSYIKKMWRMCKYDKTSFVKNVCKVLKIKKNITIILANSFSVPLFCDYVLTMGEYWDDYYMHKLSYRKDQIRIIGARDIDAYIEQSNREEAICYVSNVLVEDGTVKKNDFMAFLHMLSSVIDKQTKLYVKLHPRSDIKLYEDVFSNHNVTYIRGIGNLPAVTTFVGHRSALLGLALYTSDNLIIWRFKNEEVCFYERWASAVCTNESQLREAFKHIDITSYTNNKKEDISKVYWKNPKGSLVDAAELILNNSKGITI